MQLLQLASSNEIGSTDGVYMFSPPSDSGFEEQYIGVRSRENRVMSDEQLRKMPETIATDAHHNEWTIRRKSSDRMLSYLEQTRVYENGWILDIGCGNGWFSNLLANLDNGKVLAADINMTELRQAARVFTQKNLWFAYLDIFSAPLKANSVNVIILNSSFQYFADPKALLQRCLKLLKEDGEIHIMDSPFYPDQEVHNAQLRSQEYYHALGFAEMSKYYHHHSFSIFDHYNATFLYRPPSKNSNKTSESTERDSPFPWIRMTR